MPRTTLAYETANGPQQVDAAHPLPVAATVNATAATVAKATASAPTYSEGDAAAPLSVDLSGNLRTLASVSASIAATAQAADPSWVEGSSHGFTTDLAGYQRSLAKQGGSWSVGQTGTWTVGISASQTIGVTNLPTSVDVNSGNKSNSTVRVVLATDQPALTNKLLVTPDLPSGASTAAKQPALGTAGSPSADVITIQGVTSMTALKVDGSAVTQPVSGTFWQATQPVSFTMPALVAGTALIGKVGIDQTTPGTTNAVAATNLPTTVDTNSGNKSASTVRVVLATDQPQLTNALLTTHGKTIKTASVNISADNDIIAAVSSKRIKVIAYALFKTGTNANPIIFKSNGTGGTELARVLLQSQASAVFGANLSIAAPSFLFATVAGEKLTMDVGDSDTITGFITYFDDDAT